MPKRLDTPEAREANRLYQQKWWQANKEVQRERVKANAKRAKALARTFVDATKANGCTRCDEKDLRCLDLHHLDSSEKEFSISSAVHRGYSVQRIAQEIEKCLILCANCHRKEHRTQMVD